MITKPRSRDARLVWALLATLFLSALAWACTESSPRSSLDDGTAQAANDPAATLPPNGTGGGSSGAGSSGSGPGVDPGPRGTGTPGSPNPAPTAAPVKVAFIGDTSTGSDFTSVLQLIKAEAADFVMIQGDLTYSGDSASNWFPAIDNEINKAQPGSTATVTIPYFASKGNHDSDWDNLSDGFKTRMTQWNVTPDGNPSDANYSVVYKGVRMVMVDESETSPTRADFVKTRLTGDTNPWKICSWHKNQRNSNVGPKSDEMGWAIYENCRAAGAIVAQGHSHTYSRSKTLTNDADQTVDPQCSDPFALCVGPGKHFFFDSSLGGVDTRSLESGVASMPHFAQSYSGSFGALFITFNAGGDPKKAQGYFKTVGGTIVDPPASSGKTSFTITRTP